MNGCSQNLCYAPATSCADGEPRPENCPFFLQKTAGEQTESNGSGTARGSGSTFPWTGNSLGLSDLHLVTRLMKPQIIGLIGPHSSGKTSILAVTYLLIFNGYGIGGKGFAGSMTLTTWEQISSYFKFQGHEVPTFPPHTPSGASRSAGLLHLALRNEIGVENFLITDPPGEWFEKWSVNETDGDAEGARWIAKNASKFVFIVDSDSLARDPFAAKYRVFDLAARLASVRANRPTSIVWAKSDKTIDASHRAEVSGVLDQNLPGAEHFSLSVASADHIVEDFQRFWAWMLSDPVQDLIREPFVLEPRSEDLFLGFRGAA